MHHTLSQLTLSTSSWVGCNYPYFTDKEIGAQEMKLPAQGYLADERWSQTQTWVYRTEDWASNNLNFKHPSSELLNLSYLPKQTKPQQHIWEIL